MIFGFILGSWSEEVEIPLEAPLAGYSLLDGVQYSPSTKACSIPTTMEVEGQEMAM